MHCHTAIIQIKILQSQKLIEALNHRNNSKPCLISLYFKTPNLKHYLGLIEINDRNQYGRILVLV